MKKILSALPIAIMFALLVLLFVFMCLPQNASDTILTIDLTFLRTRGLYYAVLGSILMAAFYHLTLYIFRLRETVYLLFSIFCLVSVFHFLFTRGGLNEAFCLIPAGEFLIRFSGVISFLYHNSITIVGLYVLSRRFLLAHRKALAAYIILGISYYCFVPISFPLFGQIGSSVIIAVSIFITAIGFRSPVLRENRWTWLYFISFVFYLCTGFINLVLFVGVFFMLGLLSNLFMVLSQSLLLAKNYANAFEFAEQTNVNLEQLVDNRTKDLQNTNNAMRELVSNISHDLKTPLAVMSVNLEELLSLSRTQNDEYQRRIHTAYQKNLDLQRLTQNLLEISRIETGQSLYRPEWVSLSNLLSQVQDKYDDFLRSKDIFFEIYSSNDAEIYVDQQRIWSVFDNVIYNAARHTGESGTVTINAKVLRETAVVKITDNGCGIEPEHLPHIFERFYKASASRGGSGGDSGLGLYIVKSVMEALDGSVTAESEVGKGTSISLSFLMKTELRN